MNIILKRIGKDVSVSDIKDFIEPVLKGSFLKKSGMITSLKILLFHQLGTHKKMWNFMP
ncbi:MAG: hypothetical protein ACU88J_15940 [Gammaproteobacteria bacterium]